MASLTEKKLSMLDDLIDARCEIDGVRETIRYMMEGFGFTPEELTEMRFDAKDVLAVEIELSMHEVDC